jgi:hypothetical protein
MKVRWSDYFNAISRGGSYTDNDIAAALAEDSVLSTKTSIIKRESA